ncbi:MAG TPA: T6SS immunity protein Tdi1 domain-containing protein, partial [Cytophagales bacterium]|nr:T6SS immunity protein Tdi1 domain-containing protein [Cytophagales bacterium]
HQYFNEVNPEEFVVFGFDWLGRELAIGIEDTSLEGAIILFDPATGEYYTLEIDLKGFLNEVMVDQRNETFAFETFNQWLNQTGYKLKFSECVGFKVLLFLGGDDVIENFEVYDFDVYWELNRQTFEQIS